MSKFAYVGIDVEGNTMRGVQEATSLVDARLRLLEQDMKITELNQKRSFADIEITTPRIKRESLMHLSRQFASFIRAGIPILDAIEVLRDEADDRAVTRVMTEIDEDLRAGLTLSDAVDKHPKDFPAYYRGILRSAELTGRLDDVLDQLAHYLERDLEARRKIKSATIYPAIVALMSCATIGVLAVYVLPKFTDFFESLDAELPLPTRMLLGMTDFLFAYWWALAACLGLVGIGAALALRLPRGRRFKDRMLLGLPVLGDTIRYALVERYTRLLSAMVNAGVALPEAMNVAADSVRNAIFQDKLTVARSEMLAGGGLAGPMSRTGLFPGVAARMMRVGEDTGTLDRQLEVAAQYYERELDYKIKKFTTIFEPAVVVVMGLIVGFVAIALVSAMYGIFRTANIR
ncbi:MAG: type II secretion system F family protein [Sporichthyaceae bacterium]